MLSILWVTAHREKAMSSRRGRKAVMVLSALIALLQALTVSPARAQDSVSVYPQGTAFPLELYALGPDSDIPLVALSGWNIGHRYGWAQGGGGGVDTLDALLRTFAQNGLDGLPALPAVGIVDDTGRTGWVEADIAGWL